MTREDRRLGRNDAVQSLQTSEHQSHAMRSLYLPKFTLEERISREEGTCLSKVVAERTHSVTRGMEGFDRSVSEFERLAVLKQ